MYKDFSTGKSGDKITLVMDMFNLNYANSLEKIINDYNEYVKKNGLAKIELKPQAKWKIELVQTRSWTKDDANYWLQYRIGSTMLDLYNVKPIDYYNLTKNDGKSIDKKTIKGKGIYGYYNHYDDVFKIYQPLRSTFKFYKIVSYIQGLDQLEYKKPYLVICSSLKDAMCLRSFGYNIEVIAPDSENTLIKPYIIENLKTKYNKIITLFDNDNAGKKAIEVYKKTYNINGCALSMCKDISDAVKQHGFEKVHKNLKPLLIKKMANKKWFIPGNVPSSKNGRRWTGKYFISSKTVMKYRKDTKSIYQKYAPQFQKELKKHKLPVKISFTFIRGTKHKFDYINQQCKMIW
jgi:DNA primase